MEAAAKKKRVKKRVKKEKIYEYFVSFAFLGEGWGQVSFGNCKTIRKMIDDFGDINEIEKDIKYQKGWVEVMVQNYIILKEVKP